MFGCVLRHVFECPEALLHLSFASCFHQSKAHAAISILVLFSLILLIKQRNLVANTHNLTQTAQIMLISLQQRRAEMLLWMAEDAGDDVTVDQQPLANNFFFRKHDAGKNRQRQFSPLPPMCLPRRAVVLLALSARIRLASCCATWPAISRKNFNSSRLHAQPNCSTGLQPPRYCVQYPLHQE